MQFADFMEILAVFKRFSLQSLSLLHFVVKL